MSLTFSLKNARAHHDIPSTSIHLSALLLVSASVLVLVSSGCGLRGYVRNGFKVGPEYCKPAAPIAEDWIDADDVRVSHDSHDHGAWWSVFNDPVLDELVWTTYQQNLTLREAGFRVLEARARLGVARGSIFPQSQNINGAFSRTQGSTNTRPLPRNVLPAPGATRHFDDFAITGDALWELDIWGRFRRAIEAADADLDASVENYDDVLVCLLAEVASSYVRYRTFEQRLDYANSNVEIQKGSLNIVQTRRRAGAVTEVDVEQATQVLRQTEALVPRFQASMRVENNLLCFLTGIPPQDLSRVLGQAPIPAAPAGVAVGIPGELLRRRPDIRRAERQVAAQSARIGVAVSDLYPHFQIRGSIGYQAENLSDLVMPSSNVGIIAPTFNWDVLNYGRFRNNIQANRARFQALAIAYQNAVLRANQEVEDGLTTFLNSQVETTKLQDSATSAQRAVELTLTQYRTGAVDYNRVFVLQNTLVSQQDAYAASKGAIALNLIRVYKALGGGWQLRFAGRNPVVGGTVEVIEQPADLPPLPPPNNEEARRRHSRQVR